jgi:hypothetical protein
MKMEKILSYQFFVILWLVLLSGNLYGAEGAFKTVEKIEKSLLKSHAAQIEAEKWGEQREILVSQLRDLANQERWYDLQLKKYETYIQNQEEKIEIQEQRRQEVLQVNILLEPLLEEVLVKLENFIARDLAFLPRERQQRLAFLNDTLNEYSIGLAEKLRRVLEALHVEAEYGHTVERIESTLSLGGEDLTVSIFRLGRVGLYYLSNNGLKAGWLNPDNNKWEDSNLEQAVRLALEMADKKRVAELVSLPAGSVSK